MINRKDILKIFLILALLVGTTAGIVLTQERQDIRERAQTPTPPPKLPNPVPVPTPPSTKTPTPKPPRPIKSSAPTTPPRTPLPTSTPLVGKITLLFRQQGITTSPNSGIAEQLNTYITLKSNEGVTYKIEGIKPTVGSSGIWTASFSQDSQGRFIPAGTYDILIKGVSHLQKKFTGIQISDNQQNKIDKSTNTKDELKAGDTNNDNSITTEDLSTILKFYTDFKVPVNKNDLTMTQSDINKDGFITIDDVALVALNWSDFVVKGDE